MSEEEVKQGIKKWLEHWGLSVYTGDKFSVLGGKGRPDMLVINEDYAKKNSGIEIKRAEKTLEAEKILDYAREYHYGAQYWIEESSVPITNFLIATELSADGKLFRDDVEGCPERKRAQTNFHRHFPYIEPQVEYQRTADFIRGIWRSWSDKENMRDLNIGVLLSNRNDLQRTLDGIPEPRILVMHYTRKGRWVQWWTSLINYSNPVGRRIR